MARYLSLPAHLEYPGESGTVILQRERQLSGLQADELSRFLYGSAYLERQQRLLAILEAEPAFDKASIYFYGREELFEWALNKDKRYAQLAAQHRWDADDLKMVQQPHRGAFRV
jgi:acyl-CoA oxidase